MRAPQCWLETPVGAGAAASAPDTWGEGREGGKSEAIARYRIITVSTVNSLLNLFFCIPKETSLNVLEMIGDIFIS